LLGFSGFLWIDELIHLRPCDTMIEMDVMTLKIAHNKTDQLQLGDSVVVSRTGTRTCPVAMLERYLSTAPGDKSSCFAQFSQLKRANFLRSLGKISYSCLWECFKKKLKSLGFDANLFGIHSLRGATAAANAGVPDTGRLFKRYGRWRSENAKDGYVKDNLEARLKFQKC